MGDVTSILHAVSAGESGAEERLWREVYEELKTMAAEKMAGEAREITLQPTALVHEAWLRLAGPHGGAVTWESRRHFFGAAAEAMRRILVDHARRRLSAKRGGGQMQIPLEDAEATVITPTGDEKLIQVHDALDSLAVENPQQALVVKLRFFVGFSQREIADLLEVSEKTVQRQWILARTWLYTAIKAPRLPGGDAGIASDF